ncbi:hypothetical protein HUJ05_000017, partial [Dendroctonus ponderosae]
YYTFYECIARNALGEASIKIQLKQGFVPGHIGQVRPNTVTATTIKFSIVPPSNYDGLPIRSYSVQYKPERQPSWENALQHTWSNEINDDCINHVLKIIEPQLLEHKSFLKDRELYQALHELEIGEEEIRKYLSDKYRTILKKGNELNEHFNRYPNYLNRLYDSIIKLFSSHNKLKGTQPGRQKIDQLQANLENYSFANIVTLFRPELIKENLN